ncbi:hypothetical protein D7V81_04395 [bacterium 1XD21-70]|nr:hypothetical protein D7V81_04395 [bacterium 1XD21-70]
MLFSYCNLLLFQGVVPLVFLILFLFAVLLFFRFRRFLFLRLSRFAALCCFWPAALLFCRS